MRKNAGVNKRRPSVAERMIQRLQEFTEDLENGADIRQRNTGRTVALADRRLQDLMDRNNEGALTPGEREDLETLVELSETIAVVRAKALHLLGRKRL